MRLLWVALLVLWPAAALGHAGSVSYSSWTVEGGVARVQARVAVLDATALGGPEAALERAPRELVLRDAAGDCAPVPGTTVRLGAEPGWLRLGWRARCAGRGGPYRVRSDLLWDAVAAHAHFVRLRVPAEGLDVERVLGAGDREAVAAAVPGAAATVLRFVPEGARHALGGADHLAFLLALLLAAARLRHLLVVVTGFTIGHSVTLALAATGLVRPHAGAVEALVGLSIVLASLDGAGRGRGAAVLLLGAFAALGAAFGQVPAAALAGGALFAACALGLGARAADPGRVRVAIAALFGLVHGFGFAGALGGLELPRERVLPALLGFNAGIEVAQAGVLALAWPALAWLRRRDPGALHARAGCAVTLGAGTYWLVLRTFGGG